MSWIKDFKEFAVKGNMVDLAIGVIVAFAFGKVVNSLVSDILMPPIGFLLGGVDFSAFSANLGSVEIKYGLFINAVISFLIISFTIFLVVKGLDKLRKSKRTTKECPECLMSVPIMAKKCCHCCSEL